MSDRARGVAVARGEREGRVEEDKGRSSRGGGGAAVDAERLVVAGGGTGGCRGALQWIEAGGRGRGRVEGRSHDEAVGGVVRWRTERSEARATVGVELSMLCGG